MRIPGTETSEVLEIEVKAYRRVIRRLRYRPTCQCGCVPGIVSVPAPNRLIERGKFGVSVWAAVLLDKYLYGRPSQRLLQDLGHHGLDMSPGTLAGGLPTLAPLFDPLVDAMLAKLRSEHALCGDDISVGRGRDCFERLLLGLLYRDEAARFASEISSMPTAEEVATR